MKKYHQLIIQLSENKRKQKDLKVKREEITKQEIPLMEEETRLKQNIVKEAQMLSVALMEVELYNGTIILSGAEKDFEELSDLLSGDWGSLNMPNDVTIRINDGDVRISFQFNPEGVEDFIKEHGIKVDIDSFIRAKKDFETKLKQVNSVVSRFGSK